MNIQNEIEKAVANEVRQIFSQSAQYEQLVNALNHVFAIYNVTIFINFEKGHHVIDRENGRSATGLSSLDDALRVALKIVNEREYEKR